MSTSIVQVGSADKLGRFNIMIVTSVVCYARRCVSRRSAGRRTMAKSWYDLESGHPHGISIRGLYLAVAMAFVVESCVVGGRSGGFLVNLQVIEKSMG